MREQYLTPLGVNRVETYTQSNGRVQRIKFIDCLCKCGNKTTVRQIGIKNSSCGCRQVKSNKSRTLDITNQKFNRLLALERVDNKWRCLCDCGEQVSVLVANLKNGNTKSCGCLQKEKASKNMTKILKKYRLSKDVPEDYQITSDDKLKRVLFREFSKEIRKRDDLSCQICGIHNSKAKGLHVHHIEKWSDNEDKRFDKYNLITLCPSCHLDCHKGDYRGEVDLFISWCLTGLASDNEDALAARIPVSAL